MEFREGRVILKRELSALDKFIVNAIAILKQHVRYVIVSDYVAILFGRPRGTEDIDILIDSMTKAQFAVFYEAMKNAGYWCLNAESLDAVYRYLEDKSPIRLALKNKVFPNIELQVSDTKLKRHVLANPLIVEIADAELNISAIEYQLLYKRLILGTHVDLEDARFLEEIFKGRLDQKKLDLFESMLKEEGYLKDGRSLDFVSLEDVVDKKMKKRKAK